MDVSVAPSRGAISQRKDAADRNAPAHVRTGRGHPVTYSFFYPVGLSAHFVEILRFWKILWKFLDGDKNIRDTLRKIAARRAARIFLRFLEDEALAVEIF